MLQTSKYRPERRIVRRSISSRQSFEKRTFDIVAAIAGLLILSPLILLISLGIRIESAGSILCRHKRYNANSTEFEIFQFRTTFVDPSKHRPDDIKRITGFGQILRRSGAHKLPQLSKYPPAEPGALFLEPLKAAGGVADAAPFYGAT